MTHQHYVVRSHGDVAHVFPGQEDPDNTFWASCTSACGKMMVFKPDLSKAGDGRPVCRSCAKLAKKRGWV